jgi:hypothetical protein
MGLGDWLMASGDAKEANERTIKVIDHISKALKMVGYYLMMTISLE